MIYQLAFTMTMGEDSITKLLPKSTPPAEIAEIGLVPVWSQYGFVKDWHPDTTQTAVSGPGAAEVRDADYAASETAKMKKWH